MFTFSAATKRILLYCALIGGVIAIVGLFWPALKTIAPVAGFIAAVAAMALGISWWQAKTDTAAGSATPGKGGAGSPPTTKPK